MGKIRVNSIEIDYQEYGPKDGEAIVFIHGAGGNLLSWFNQIAYFSPTYRCVTFSHRGFGHSTNDSDLGIKNFTDDLEGLLDALGIDSVHLVSQSMGGVTATGFAAKFPERVKTITYGDTPGAIWEPDVEKAFLEWSDTNMSQRAVGYRGLSEGFWERNPALSNLYLQISKTNPQRQLSMTLFEGGPKGEELLKLNMPILFIVGEEDDLTPPHIIKLASNHIKGSQMIIVPNCGHSVYFENPDVFNFEVGSFIQESLVR